MGAETLGITGSLGGLRDMAELVMPSKESGLVQRLTRTAEPITELENDFISFLDLMTFRANRGDSKVVLTALWSRHPMDIRTDLPMALEKLTDQLENDSTPRVVTTKFVPDSAKETGSAASRLISFIDHQEFITHANTETNLSPLLLNEQMLSTLQKNRHKDFLRLRSAVLRCYLADFLSVHAAYEHKDAPLPEE